MILAVLAWLLRIFTAKRNGAICHQKTFSIVLWTSVPLKPWHTSTRSWRFSKKFSCCCSPHAHGVIRWESEKRIGNSTVLKQHTLGTVSTSSEPIHNIWPSLGKVMTICILLTAFRPFPKASLWSNWLEISISCFYAEFPAVSVDGLETQSWNVYLHCLCLFVVFCIILHKLLIIGSFFELHQMPFDIHFMLALFGRWNNITMYSRYIYFFSIHRLYFYYIFLCLFW